MPEACGASHEETLSVLAIEELSHDLRVIGSGDAPANGFIPATRGQTEARITELLDMTAERELARQAFFLERTFEYHCVKVLTGKADDPEIKKEPGLPSSSEKTMSLLFKWDGVFMLDFSTAMAEAVYQDNFPAAKKILPPEPAFEGWWDSLSYTLSNILRPSFERMVIMDFRGRAKRVMAATALAIRLYEIDHGRRPEKLADLVPDYLDAAPDDPFAAPGTPIGYLPNAPRPLLYSIGENGIDQHGTYAADPNDPPEMDDYDLPFFLNGDRPKPPPEEGEGDEESFDDEQSDEELFDEESATQPATPPATPPATISD